MKHFKLMKGVFACLLSLALVLAIGGTVGTRAAATAGKFTYVNQATTLLDVTVTPATGVKLDAIEDGNKITVTAVAKDGKEIEEVKFGEETITASSGKYSKDYTIDASTAESGLEIVVTATEKTYKITSKFADVHSEDTPDVTLTKEDGTTALIGEDDLALAKGTAVKFKVVLGDGIKDTKQVKSVKVGTEELTAKSGVYTFTVAGASEIDVTIEDIPVISAEYQVDTDTIKFTANHDYKVLYTTVKKAGSKVSKTSELQLEANKDEDKDVENDEFIGEIVLNSADGGIKIAEDKDLYLWYGVVAPDKKTSVKPLLTVEGAKVKKFSVVLNYVVAGDEEKSGIASATTKKGKTETNLDLKTLQYRYYDGTKWGDWTDIVEVDEEEKETIKFNGSVIQKALTDAAENEVLFEIKVKASAADADATPAKNAIRGSKAVKIKVVKPAAAPKIKVDYVKGTVAIKNGYDYAVLTDGSKTPAIDEWMTILPEKKGGKATEPIASIDYVPAKKLNSTNANMFAKDKVKNVAISDLFGESDAETIYVYVRKSAVPGKPASAACEKITIKKAAAAPSFSTVTAEGTYNAKKKTFSYVLEAPEALTDGTYEYLIVKEADIAKLDTNAKWSKLGTKGITVNKAKSKVSKSVTNVLKADGSYYILIRKAAVKSGEDAALASAYVKTSVSAPVAGGTTEEPTSTITWSVVS